MENMDKRKFRNGMIIYLLILIVAFILINRWMQSDKIEVTTTYSYTDLTEDLDDGKILACLLYTSSMDSGNRSRYYVAGRTSGQGMVLSRQVADVLSGYFRKNIRAGMDSPICPRLIAGSSLPANV